MAKYSNQVVYDIKTTLDASGITKLRSELNKLNQEVTTIGKTQWGLKDSEIQRTVAQVNRLQKAITECFNPRIGMLDLSKFNRTLEQEKALLGNINSDWAKMGAQGTRAINSLASSILTLNKDAITMNSTLSKIANTFSNTVRWGITASIFQEMMSSVQGAVSYMKDLDESLTQIQMVTGSSKENMRELAQYANNAAQALGSTTTDYTNAVKVFVQEGFSESESKQYANLSTKLANVSEQNTATTSDQITAFRNAFQLDYEQTVAAMDKVANVANNTASNVNELMTASQRAASVAQAVGSSQDSFLAAIATIESVTRQSAEEIGNGLKTIYQRFADIKVGGSTEDGVDYGQYANALKSIGVDVLDAAGEFKGMDQILQETQEVWSGLSDTMKVAVGEKVAGKFQYNRFAALMNNQDYYEKALAATGESSEGMMDQMNEIYTESIEGRLKTLQAAGEQIMSTLFNQDNVEPIIGAATDFLNVINKIIDTVGGGLPVFTALSGILLRTFNAQIGEQVARITTNIQASIQAAANTKYMDDALGQVEQRVGKQGGQSGAISQIRDVLQGESFAGLTENTQEKVLNSAQELLNAENKVADIKEQQDLLQKQINEDIANSTKVTESLLKTEILEYEKKKEIYEDDKIALEEDEIWLENQKEENGISNEEYEIRKKELAVRREELDISRQEMEAAELKLDNTRATLDITRQIEVFDESTYDKLIAIDQLNENKTEYAKQYLELTQQATHAEGELVATSSKLKGVKDQIDIEKQAAGITNLVSGLTSVAFLVQSITSLVNTLNDDSLSISEKAGAILSSLVMILPMAITAYQSFVAAKAADISVTTLLIGATGALTTAVRGLGIAIASLPVIGQIALAITAIITAIAALIVVFDNFILKTNNANEEYERQAELLKDLQSNYEELNSSVQELKQSMESLEQKRNALSELKEGTIEWKEAVLDLNEQVLSLLETYPKLAEYINSENGVLNISEEGLDTIYNEQMQKVQTAQNMVAIQQVRTRQGASDAALEDFANEHRWLSGGQGIDTDILKNVTNRLNDSSLTIEEACKNLGLDVEENGTDLRILAEKIQSNNVAIDALNTTLEETNDYRSFASTPDGEKVYQEAAKNLETKYGHNVFNQGGFFEDSAIVAALDHREQIVNEQDFKDLVQGAMPELQGSITLIKESADSWNWVIKTSAGEEREITKENLKEKMALYQAEQDIEQKKLEENKKIYENLGVEWDSTTNKPKSELSADNQAALDAFQNNESFQKVIKEYSDTYNIPLDTAEQFSAALRDGAINVDGLAEAIKKLTPEVADLTHNINGNEFTNRVDISSNKDDLKKILEDAEMSEGAFGRMARDSYEDSSGYYQQEKARLEELIKVKKEDGIVTENESEEIKKLNSEIEGLNESSRDTTAMIVNMSDGVVDLRKKIEDISEILSNEGLKGSVEWYEALTDLDEGLSQVLNIDTGTLSDVFLESGDALAYAQRMAEGDMSAIDDLRRVASQDIIQNLNIQITGDESVDELRAELMVELNQLQADIDAGAITITTDLDTHPFVNKLNEMLASSQISAEQATQILSSMGMEANIKHAKGKGTVQAIEYQPILALDAMNVDLGPLGTFKVPGIKMSPVMTDVEVETDIPYLEGTHYTGSGVQTAGTAASNPSYSGGYNGNPKQSSSGSSSPKSNSTTPKDTKPKNKENTEWDYLTDITNDLNRAAAAMEKLAKLEDRLYGKNRVSQLKKLQGEYKKYIKLLQQEVKLAQGHAKILRENAYDENGNLTMSGYAYRAGVSQLQFDSTGNLENGKEIEKALIDRVNQRVFEYNTHRNDDDASYYEDRLRLAEEDHSGFMKALSDYQSTLDKIEDGQSQIQEYQEKIQDAADEIVDSIQQGIEDMLEAMDSQRDFNKMYRDWTQGGSDYSHFDSERQYYSEGLSNLFSSSINGKSIIDTQIQNLADRIKDAEKVFDNSPNNADKEKLSEAAAQENLREATDNIMDTLHQMIDYYDSLWNVIEEASEKMDELIDNRLNEYTNIEDFLNIKLDQLKLVFGDKTYEQQAQLYNQKILANTEKITAINDAIEAKQATVKALEKLEANGKKLSTEERKELKNARDEVNKLQKEQLDTQTKIYQDMQDKLKVQVTADIENMMKELFNGADVDWLSEQWELATRNSEKYLDDYNRAFEVQKLQLKFQEALNDNQNSSLAAQKKINDLADEYLTYLREKEHLSEYDVKHAQMQLDILQKQIALEDARNNKSQMRLQRNAAGNYDFVYAADENAINEATEALLQAQQDSYNLSKQTYLETYESALKAATEIRDMVVQIATDASLNTEERVERIHFVLESLNEYMQGSSVELGEISINLYNSFVEASQSIAETNQGALSDVFEQMREQALVIQDAVGTSVENVKDNIVSEEGPLNIIKNGIIGLGDSINTQIKNANDSFFNAGEEIKEGIIGENGTLSGIKSGIDGFEQSLISEDGTLGKIKVGTKNFSSELLDKIVLPTLDSIDTRFKLSESNAISSTDKTEEAIQTASVNITGTTTKELEKIDENVVQTLTSIFGSITDTNGNTVMIIDGIVTKVQDSGKKVEDVYNKADEKLKKSIDNAIKPSGYLKQFEQEVEKTFREAGKNADEFTEKSVDVANDRLGVLRDTTGDWRGDLNDLKTTISDTAKETETWKKRIGEVLDKLKGTNSNGLISKANDLAKKIAASGAAASIAADHSDTFADATDRLGDAIDTAANKASDGYNNIRDAALEAADAYDDMKTAAQDAKVAAEEAQQAAADAKTAAQDAQTAIDNYWNYTEGFTSSGGGKFGQNYEIPDLNDGFSWPIQYASGGYTGSWSDKGIDDKSGKLAVLHQKELVLNAADTENILSAVDLVRDIMSNINSIPSLGRIIPQSNFGDNIEQRVEIQATFPGVTEVEDIKQALIGLADSAYQYANKYQY